MISQQDEYSRLLRAVAQGVRRLRIEAKMTGHDLAALVGISQSKISRIERERVVPSEHDVTAILRALHAPASISATLTEQARLLATWEQSSFAQVSDDSLGLTERAHAIERSSKQIDEFHNRIISGLLQTRRYAQAVLEVFMTAPDFSEMSVSEERVVDAVVLRMQRQAQLPDDRKRFRFLMAESSLRVAYGSIEILLEQLHALLECRRPNVEIGVIPDYTPTRCFASWQYYIYDARLVFIELPVLPGRGEWLHDEPRVKAHVAAFEQLWEISAKGSDAYPYIERAIERLPREGELTIDLWTDSPLVTERWV